MASISFSSSSSPATSSNRSLTALPTTGPRQVPLSKKKNIAKFDNLLFLAREYDLGDEARLDLCARGERLIRKIKPIIVRHAADEDGAFRKTWKDLSTTRCGITAQSVHKVAPWLLNFEENWATDWILKRLIDQRVHDRNRAKARRKEEDRDRQRLTELANDTLDMSTEGEYIPSHYTRS
jgi:hypothetical protein